MKEEITQQKTIAIYVNGTEKEVIKDEYTFEELVALAFENPPSGPNVVITITYYKGEHDKKEGNLFAGQSIKVKKGIVFNVTATDKS